jgi:hypothetical protein
VRYKLAILNALAGHPGGRATLEDVRREAELIIANLDPIQVKRFEEALGNNDIFQSRLVVQDDVGWQITPAGLALLDGLQDLAGSSFERGSAAASTRGTTGDFIQSELPSQPFDAELRTRVDLMPPITADEHEIGATEVRHGKPHKRSADRGGAQSVAMAHRVQKMLRSLDAFVSRIKQAMLKWRPAPLGRKRSTGAVSGNVGSVQTIANVAVGVMALLFVVTAVLAAIALGQIQSLKSDIALLRRELLPVKERFAKFEEAENQRRDQDQQQEAQKRSQTAAAEVRSDPNPLNLTWEEIQLVREYIKPAPAPASGEPEINVGDAVGGAMIPLPSPLTDKVPKLVGARFTTRNGAIVLVKKDSRRADAVLGPH